MANTALLAELDELESQLQALALWQSEPPAPEALASQQPFCVDTLHFHQWLQWIMLPRLRQMLASGAALPSNSNMAVMAEHAFAQRPEDTAELLSIVQAIDECLNNP